MSLRHLPSRHLRDSVALVLSLVAQLASAQSGSTPLIYEVRSETTTVYLFGTVHVGTRAMYPLSQNVEKAFAASRALALEANPLNQQDVSSAMAMTMYKSPDDLAKHVAASLFDRVKTVAPRVGLPVEYARKMKPHMLSMTLALMEIQRLGYDAGLGLDVHLAQRATTLGMPILELESMQAQVALFEALPGELQEGMLSMALDAIEDGKLEQEMKSLVAAWVAGDPERIHAAILREMEGLPEPIAQELWDAIYNRRNATMATKVAELLARDEPVFVAIGAGHLIGDTGMPELLKRRGFQVRRL